MKNLETKPCAVCGRKIEWRKKWEKSWNEVRYCSDRCRRSKPSMKTEGLLYETKILELLQDRSRGRTICPSDVLDGNDKENPEMVERVRQAARRLVAKGELEILQNGKPVDPSTARGTTHFRLRWGE